MSLTVVPAAPKFVMKMHLCGSTYGVAMYRDDALGVQAETYTPKKRGQWGHGTTTYSIDGDDRQFKTMAELMTALEERKP